MSIKHAVRNVGATCKMCIFIPSCVVTMEAVKALLHISCFLFSFLLEILAAKKKTYSELAKKINNTKVEIDNTRQTLDRLRIEREAEGQDLLFTPRGAGIAQWLERRTHD